MYLQKKNVVYDPSFMIIQKEDIKKYGLYI